MILGNIIFPALSAAYVLPLLLPVTVVLALIVEGLTVHHLESGVNWGPLWAMILGANVWSWIVGIFLTGSGLFLTGLTVEDGRVSPGPQFMMLAFASYLLAWALSTVLEFAVYYLLRKKLRIGRPFRAALLANTGSYVAIVVIFLFLEGLARLG